MGVMSCSRNGCESIMCQTHIDDVGYICSSCKIEFEEFLEKRILIEGDLYEGEIIKALKSFMETEPSLEKGEKISLYDFFRKGDI